MLNIDEEEVLTLYFYLSQSEFLLEPLDSLLIKLEKKLFDIYTVKEIEEFSIAYKNKEKC